MQSRTQHPPLQNLLLFVPRDQLKCFVFAACSAKQTKTSRAGSVIKEINKSSTGRERMGPRRQIGFCGKGESVGPGSERAVSPRYNGGEGAGGRQCESRGANSEPAEQPVSIWFTISVMGTSLLFSFHYVTNLCRICLNNSGITAYLPCVAA